MVLQFGRIERDAHGYALHHLDPVSGCVLGRDHGESRSRAAADARDALKENAEYLKNNGDLTILVEGHCDERGTFEYNLALGQKRAMAVRVYYISLGISPTRVGTISYGSEKPVEPGHDDCRRRCKVRTRSNEVSSIFPDRESRYGDTSERE